jgi:hypothetical protein
MWNSLVGLGQTVVFFFHFLSLWVGVCVCVCVCSSPILIDAWRRGGQGLTMTTCWTEASPFSMVGESFRSVIYSDFFSSKNSSVGCMQHFFSFSRSFVSKYGGGGGGDGGGGPAVIAIIWWGASKFLHAASSQLRQVMHGHVDVQRWSRFSSINRTSPVRFDGLHIVEPNTGCSGVMKEIRT